MSVRLPVTFALLRELARYPAGLLALCLTFLGVSLVVLKSAAMSPSGQLLPYFERQLVWASAGLVVFMVVSFSPYSWVGRRSWILYGLGLCALLAVFVIGTKVNGSRRWFSVGPVRIQPSEFMKYIVVVFLAHAVARRGTGVRSWGGLLEAGFITAVPFCLILMQPDLGTALSYTPILAVMVVVAGARWRHLSLIGLAGVAMAPLAWIFVMKDYQKDRIWAFLFASDHAKDSSYQTLQSEIAIGSGGLLGRGYMQGTQGSLGFIPERHTDFIFAVVCEDFGMIGGVLLLGLYGYLICYLAKLARETRDPEGRLIVCGVATIVLFQVIVNVGMTLGVMPVTGLTLPLVSYGGSSLVASMFGFGLVAAVARSRVLVFSGRAC